MNWRWLVWLLFVGVWTWALLLPNPERWARALILPETIVVPEDHPVRQELLEMVLSLVFSKTLHVAGYAVLAILSGWQRLTGPFRWALLAFLSLHALGTEFFQAYVPGRHPSWRDVGLDHVGIVLGLALTWKWWLRTNRREVM
jgi:VanZ family protein